MLKLRMRSLNSISCYFLSQTWIHLKTSSPWWLQTGVQYIQLFPSWENKDVLKFKMKDARCLISCTNKDFYFYIYISWLLIGSIYQRYVWHHRRLFVVFLIRSVSFRFEEQHSCQSWFNHLQRALTSQKPRPKRPPPPKPALARQSLYPVMDVGSRGSVPPAIERCISHITTHGQFIFTQKLNILQRVVWQSDCWCVCQQV